MTLHPLVGHDEARRMVAGSHRAGRLPSSLLLHGPRGVGKQRFALWIAQVVVCETPAEAPCGRCRGCRMLLGLEHPDVHWYFPLPRPRGVGGDRLADALEDARHEALAELRRRPLRPSHTTEVTGLYMGTVQNVRKRAHIRPTMAGPVFIIGDAELLVPQEASQEAANALLKLLEEPPGDARFILTSSEPGSLLPTIRSRTVPLHLGTLTDEQVRDALVERLEVDAEGAAWAARLGHGSLGRALGFLPESGDDDDKKGPLDELRRQAFLILRTALHPRGSGRHALALGYPPAGARALLDLLQFLEEWVRDLGAVLSLAEERVFHHDAVEGLRELGRRSGVVAARVPGALPAIERARVLSRGNVNPQLVVAGLVRELRAALLPTADVSPAAR